MTELTIVRENLMAREGYSPYCGAGIHCSLNMPRTRWNPNENQFACRCGWKSELPSDFIERYKQKWNK